LSAVVGGKELQGSEGTDKKKTRKKEEKKKEKRRKNKKRKRRKIEREEDEEKRRSLGAETRTRSTLAAYVPARAGCVV